MSDEAKQLLAALTVMYFMGRPHGQHCDCPACKAWEVCDDCSISAFTELDELSGRKPEPIKTI